MKCPCLRINSTISDQLQRNNQIFLHFFAEIFGNVVFFLYLCTRKQQEPRIMTDKELFIEVFNRTTVKAGVTLSGTLVYYRGECKFNIDGFNLAYNLHRLTNLLEEIGEFR